MARHQDRPSMDTTIYVATPNAEPAEPSEPTEPVASRATVGNVAIAGQKRAGNALRDYRAAKRRSSQACLSCRNRKVRCDVTSSGASCTNCRLDHIDCVVVASSRSRKDSSPVAHQLPMALPIQPPRLSYDNSVSRRETGKLADAYPMSLVFEEQSNAPQCNELATVASDSQDHSSCASLDNALPCQRPFLDEGLHLAVSGDTVIDEMVTGLATPQRSHCSQWSQASDMSNGSQSKQLSSLHKQATMGLGNNTLHADNSRPSQLPPYIKPLPSHIGPRDIEYLADKDALTIPDTDFRDELLRTYVKIIYCSMPALDLEDLIEPIINGDGTRPVSLLLFQAVMFASVIFVDSSLLQSRGFPSRKAARKIFFNRARLLYGLDCEQDHMTLIQSLLLMTYWYDSPDDEKDTWHWMGITLSLSQVVGLHRDPETWDISLRTKRLRRRMWWACFMRDRLLALGLRRPARVRQEDFNVPMLELADFDLCQPVKERIAFVRECGFTSVEEDGRRQMCEICIDLAKLCVGIGNILSSQYSVVGINASGSQSYKNIAVLPQQSAMQLAALAKCDNELTEWFANRKDTSRYSRRSSSSPGPGPKSDDWAEDITWLHQAQLHMIYLTALGALHRPRALMSSSYFPEAADADSSKRKSLSKVKEAAIAMAELAFDLQSEDLLRYLSTSSVPAFLSATVVHLLDIRHPNEEVRNTGIGRFYQCFHTLCELQDLYTSADYALRFLGTVLERFGANLPMLPILKAYTNNAIPGKTEASCDSAVVDTGKRHGSTSVDADNGLSTCSAYMPIAEASAIDYPIAGLQPSIPPTTISHPHQCAMSMPPPQADCPQSIYDLIQPLSPIDGNILEGYDNLLFGSDLRDSTTTETNADASQSQTVGVDVNARPLSNLSVYSDIDVWGDLDGLLFAIPGSDATIQGL